MNKIRLILIPLAWVYGAILWLRNTLYDLGILNGNRVPVKTIAVGNLSLGGTGKTPHIEYLIRLLHPRKLAVLSRGYGREGKGTLRVLPKSDVKFTGDEPLQIAKKFPETVVVVDENRLRGVSYIQKNHPEVECVLLDDAFQHRRIIAGFYLLLTEYSRPFYKDHYLPAGNLRDHKQRARDANTVIVTKCPKILTDKDKNNFTTRLEYLNLPIIFDSLKYEGLMNPNGELIKEFPKDCILLTGIANPQPFEEYLQSQTKIIRHLKFPDHHDFDPSDIEQIRKVSQTEGKENTAIITTEKDMMRLIRWMDDLKGLQLYYCPISIDVGLYKEQLDAKILNYVGK